MKSRVVATTILEGYRSVHDTIRKEISGLGENVLNWTPGEESNSIATLVTHMTGSEIEVIKIVTGNQSERDRAREFTAGPQDEKALLARLERADSVLEEFGETITEADLSEPRARRDRGSQPGLQWLVVNYGHAREHLGQLQLTKQLYFQQNA